MMGWVYASNNARHRCQSDEQTLKTSRANTVMIILDCTLDS